MENRNDNKKGVGAEEGQELEKFVAAQQHDYATALAEISSGRKRSHWMWYIFPQLDGLGFSDMAKRYGIRDLKQASAYLKHPLLGSRLTEISEALLTLEGVSASEIFGSPDDLKLRSSMSLFASVAGAPGIFQQVLDKFFSGHKDIKTLRILGL